jgi:hypothetical protein
VNSESSETGLRGIGSVVVSVALVGAVLLLVALCAAPLALERHGIDGLIACFVAAALCWLSASSALLITVLTAHGPQVVSGLFLAIGIRMGAPLVAGVAATVADTRLAEAGLFGLIVVHYLVALAAETPVAVYLVSSRNRMMQ